MLRDDIRIKENLEETFDIPFDVKINYESGEPGFLLTPENPGKELFTIRVNFRSRIRLIMDFLPQKYSVHFIESMGKPSLEKRKLFATYLETMKRKGAKCVIKVNNELLSPDDSEKWRVRWKSFEARITKIPISDGESFAYTDTVIEWGSIMVGMILALTEIVPVESENYQNGYREGTSKKVEINRYERNPLNRKLCLANKGYSCAVCGMNFEKIYGEIGRNYIHVHHTKLVSQIGPDYIIDPIKDLVPVCPNCHAMLHRSNPPLMPEQLEAIMKRQCSSSEELSCECESIYKKKPSMVLL